MPTYTANRWRAPEYKGAQRTKEPFFWTMTEVQESECPVSSITQRSFELVQIVNLMQGAHKSTGSTVGADEMPGYLLDAIRVCESESQAVEAAMDEANT